MFGSYGNWIFYEEKVLLPKGLQESSMFGFSIANIGDIDKDSLEDFVVGAPMAGQNGAGAIYVFHGCKDFAFGKRHIKEMSKTLSNGNQ